MNLKDFLANREKPPELYWSLVLEEGWVQAGIWYIGQGVSEVVSISPGAAWLTEEELITSTDATLSSAIQKLPEDGEEPTKTVFGVPGSWVKDGEIVEEHLSKIKKICTNLSLSPVGFVVLPEAIAHLSKSDEGAPLSAIILGLGKDNLEISVFRMGALSGTTKVARSVSLIEDVTEGLTRFEGGSPLPSRIIIFDGKGGELEEAKESLIQATWDTSEKVKFLHTPKVEILPPDKKVVAVSLAGANEIEGVAKVHIEGEKGEVIYSEDDPSLQNVAEPEVNLSPEELGFALNEDVSQKVEKNAEEPVASIPPQPQSLSHSPNVASYIEETKHAIQGLVNEVLPHGGPPTHHHGTQKSKRKLTLAIAIAVVFLISIGLFWWFYPKAVVAIYVTPKKLEHEASVAFDTKGGGGEGVIAASVAEDSVSGTKTKATTGTKTIGDKAKGKVRIQNGTAFPINVSAGAFVVSSGNLKFTLDQSASVSAALSPSAPGVAEVSVTADSIGAQYNLAKDEVFRIGNYPKAEVDGTSTADFSGGSSREISAVDKKDQESLTEELQEELKTQVYEKLSSNTDTDKVFVNDLAVFETDDSTFDHKVGDESDTVKLSLTLNAKGIVVDREKLLEFARNLLKDKVPSGYVLRDSQITFQFKFVDSEDDKFNYDVVIGANFLPEVNIDNIAKQIAGKTPEVTEKYLIQVPGFERAEVRLKPRLPGFLGTLPRVRKNLTVEVVANQ